MAESIQKKKDDLAILTVREVADYLRMSQAKVYRLAKERRLPVVRIGKTWRFRKDLLDEWLSKCTESTLITGGEAVPPPAAVKSIIGDEKS